METNLTDVNPSDKSFTVTIIVRSQLCIVLNIICITKTCLLWEYQQKSYQGLEIEK